MNNQFKVILYMNIMFNLLLAVIFSAVAQFLSQGGIAFPAILLDIVIAFVIEMIVALCLPFSKWGMALGHRYAAPGSLKQRILTTTGTALPFSIIMCLSMSFIGSVLFAHLPVAVWFSAFLRILPIFIVLGWVMSFIFVPVFMGIAEKMVNG